MSYYVEHTWNVLHSSQKTSKHIKKGENATILPFEKHNKTCNAAKVEKFYLNNKKLYQKSHSNMRVHVLHKSICTTVARQNLLL